MIVYKRRPGVSLQLLVDLVIAGEPEVDWTPEIVALVYRVFLGNLRN
jgi:hypothetical protein